MCSSVVQRSLAVLFAIWTASVTVVRGGDEVDIGCVSASTEGTVEQRCFTLHKTPQTWDKAEISCIKDGGLMAVINEPQLEEMVAKILTLLEKDVEDDSGFNAWIGGRELDDTTWKWLNGEQFQIDKAAKANISVSFSTEPKDYENCAAVSVASKGSTLELKSSMCRTRMKQFLCQQQVSTSASGNVLDTGPCSIDNVPGVRVQETCYAALSAKQEAVSWFKAAAGCHAVNATLATGLDTNVLDVDVNSTTDKEAVANYLESVATAPGQSIWIGLRRYPWVWVTEYDDKSGNVSDTESMSYTAWFEPDQPNKDGQDCVLVGSRGTRFGWYDEKCDSEAPYVCENRTIVTTTVTTTEAATVAVTGVVTKWPGSVDNLTIAMPSNTTSTDNEDEEEESDWKLITAIVVCALIGLVVLTVFAAVCAYFAARRSGYEKQP